MAIETKTYRIVSNSNDHTLRNEIAIDFSNFPIVEEGRFCVTNLQFKVKPIRKLKLSSSEKIGAYIELPRYLKIRDEGKGNSFKKIAEIKVGDIVKTKEEDYTFDMVTYDLFKDDRVDSNVGYLYLEYKLINMSPKKIDPKILELKVTFEYEPNINNRQTRNGCAIL